MSQNVDNAAAPRLGSAEDRRATPQPVAHDPGSLIENMFAPELYATFASSFSVSAGSVTIKLVSSRWDNSVEPAVQKAVVVGRVTLPLQGAQTLAAGLQNFLSQNGLGHVASDRPRTRASDAVISGPNAVKL
ncbi:hypothetical protein [Acidisoma sp.]|uniref:hypothetical protein n=1 Tax=Acidisoma sp. TaxID=1872115 RepID=UPI003AFFF2D8